jgi:hydrogenase maturation protease
MSSPRFVSAWGADAMPNIQVLVIGCGNPLRGDDAAGPVLVRRLWDRGLPEGVRCADGGTGGMDVVFQMRGVPEVILVDACRTGAEPGAIFEVPGDEVANLPPLAGINLHAFRWDHALAFARWLLREGRPERVSAILIEGATFDVGAALSPAVDRAIDAVVDRLGTRFAPEAVGKS